MLSRNRNRISRLAMLLFALGITGEGMAVDLWRINEVFSSADGRVQFIELHTTASNQNPITNFIIASQTQSGNDWTAPGRSVVLDRDLTGDTADRTLLIATQYFVDQTGISPDFLMPENFLPLTGGTITYGPSYATFDSLAISPESLPLNGVQSLSREGFPQSATPANFSGDTASLDIPPVATTDLATGILHVPVVDVPGFGVVNLNLDIDLQTLEFALRDDFFLYGEGISAGSDPARFENGDSLYLPNLVLDDQLIELRLDLAGWEPVLFGNPEVIAIDQIPHDLNADPAPNWIITEAFTNVDGTVQFVELFTSGVAEQNLAGATLRGGTNFFGSLNTFTFPDDLVGSTRNRSLLLATAAFEDVSGVVPDYILPDSFLPTATTPQSKSVDFNQGADRLLLQGNILPLNGFQSLHRQTGPGIATPTNFSGQSGTVNAGSYAVFNAQDNTILFPEVDRGEQGIEGSLFLVDLENLLLRPRVSWPLRFGILTSDAAAIYSREGSRIEYYVPKLLIGEQFYELRFEWIDLQNAYGNIQVLSVTDR